MELCSDGRYPHGDADRTRNRTQSGSDAHKSLSKGIFFFLYTFSLFFFPAGDSTAIPVGGTLLCVVPRISSRLARGGGYISIYFQTILLPSVLSDGTGTPPPPTRRHSTSILMDDVASSAIESGRFHWTLCVCVTRVTSVSRRTPRLYDRPALLVRLGDLLYGNVIKIGMCLALSQSVSSAVYLLDRDALCPIAGRAVAP